MPKANINLLSVTSLDLLIEYFKFATDWGPHPSKFSISLKSNLKISCGKRINLFSQNFSTTFFPSPSMFKASLETKCLIFSIAIFSHL